MGLRAWNVGVLLSALGLLLASGTQREKSVLAAEHADSVRGLEAKVAAQPTDAVSLRQLSQRYVDLRAPGMALRAIEDADAHARTDATVQHVYARALLDEGRAAEALAVERRVLESCAEAGCETWLIASATRRADILRELVELGVEDAQAHPESAAIAYYKATREAHLAVAVR